LFNSSSTEFEDSRSLPEKLKHITTFLTDPLTEEFTDARSLPGLSQTEAADYYELLSKGLGADAAKKELAEMGFDPETFEAIEKYSNDPLTEEFTDARSLPEKLGGFAPYTIAGENGKPTNRFSDFFEDPLTEEFTSRTIPALFGLSDEERRAAIEKYATDPLTEEFTDSRSPQLFDKVTSRTIPALFGRGSEMPAVANEFLGQSHPSPVSDLIEAANEIHLAGMEDVRQRGFDHDVEMIARQLSPASPTNQTGVGMGAQQDQTLRVTGTLSLQGLQDVLLNARGQQSIPVEGSGAPIVIDPPNMYSSPSAPQKV